jgi:propanol-preferring alcohol dehydrogenase
MQAMVLPHPGPIEQSPLQPEEVPQPVPGENEIRVCISCCGVCHTDLHIAEGDLQLPKLPIIPGHQIVGRVDAVGAGVRSPREGDRVGIPWLHSTDGTCFYCRRDLENLCEHGRFTGYHTDGGYAQYALARADFAFALPTTFSDEHAAPLLCAGIIGYRAFRLTGAKRGDRIGLYGFGGSAHLVLQFARHLGCEVWVFTRSESHREVARRLGAAWVGAAGEQTHGQLDAAIIFAPAGPLVPLALGALRKAGTLALAGITMSDIPALNYSLLYDEHIVRSVANSTRQDAREFLALAAAARLETEIQMFDLSQANAALQALKHSQIAAAAVLRIPQ